MTLDPYYMSHTLHHMYKIYNITHILATDTYTMQFKDNFGAIVPLLNATCDWYCDTIDTDSLANGQVTVNVNKDATSVQLFQLQITHESEMGPNQFQSTIVAV